MGFHLTPLSGLQGARPRTDYRSNKNLNVRVLVFARFWWSTLRCVHEGDYGDRDSFGREDAEDGHFGLRTPLASMRRLDPHMVVGRVFFVNSESQTFVKTSGVSAQLQYAQLDGKVPGKNLTDKGRPDSPP